MGKKCEQTLHQESYTQGKKKINEKMLKIFSHWGDVNLNRSEI